MAGAATCLRILDAIERLQAKAPAEGEKVHYGALGESKSVSPF